MAAIISVNEQGEKTIDISKVPGVVVIKNEGVSAQQINISGMSQSLPIEPGDTVKIKVETSAELIGYLSQETEGSGITVEMDEATAEPAKK